MLRAMAVHHALSHPCGSKLAAEPCAAVDLFRGGCVLVACAGTRDAFCEALILSTAI